MSKTIISASVLTLLSGTALAADVDAPVLRGVPIRPPVQYDYNHETEPVVQAQEHVSGFIEGRYKRAAASDFDLDGDHWAIRGTFNLNTGHAINIQLDGRYSRWYIEDFDFASYGGTAHAYVRPDQRYAVGAFFGASRSDTDLFDKLGFPSVDPSTTDLVGGIEGAYFINAATFYGRAGYGRLNTSSLDLNHYLGALGMRVYATDNIRFDLEGAINRVEAYDEHVDDYAVTATANYRPDGLPVTIFGGYRFDQIRAGNDATSYGHANVNSLFAGLRLSFGSTSLKDEERSGPVWTDVSWVQE